MKIAITGASGLIGQALSASLAADGHQVVPVVRSTTSASAEVIEWNPASGTIETEKFEGIDGVVHLAGAGIGDHRWSESYKREILESRTMGTALLATALASLDAPPSVLVSGSAIGFYGDTGTTAVDESAPAATDFLASVCVEWEAAAAPAAAAGIRVPFLRTGIVLSAKGGALAKMLPLFRFGLGGRMGSGAQYWSWISMTDEVRAIQWLLTNDIRGPVNATAPTPVTNKEFTAALGAAMHRPTFAPVPAFGPKLLLGAELADALLFTSTRVLPAALESSGFTFTHPTIEKALTDVLTPAVAA
ncbi:MAG: TIGR01777 family oxidoreductase [Acidimicrobiales bacterium]